MDAIPLAVRAVDADVGDICCRSAGSWSTVTRPTASWRRSIVLRVNSSTDVPWRVPTITTVVTQFVSHPSTLTIVTPEQTASSGYWRLRSASATPSIAVLDHGGSPRWTGAQPQAHSRDRRVDTATAHCGRKRSALQDQKTAPVRRRPARCQAMAAGSTGPSAPTCATHAPLPPSSARITRAVRHHTYPARPSATAPYQDHQQLTALADLRGGTPGTHPETLAPRPPATSKPTRLRQGHRRAEWTHRAPRTHRRHLPQPDNHCLRMLLIAGGLPPGTIKCHVCLEPSDHVVKLVDCVKPRWIASACDVERRAEIRCPICSPRVRPA